MRLLAAFSLLVGFFPASNSAPLEAAGLSPVQDFPYRVGVARRDITPERPIWLAGYGNRDRPSEGVDHPLFVKALAVEDAGGNRLLLLTLDVIGVSREFSDSIGKQLEQNQGLSRSRLMVVASHTHTGPVIDDQLVGMFELPADALETIRLYTQRLSRLAMEAAEEALNRLQPARILLGRTSAGFAVNRRIFTPRGIAFGVNLDGAVDHDVSVLLVEAPGNQVVAIVFGYACHGTTLTGNDYQISNDWPGFAAAFLEEAYPGATAIFVTGLGGDSNPEPRGRLEDARRHGLEMAGAVTAALSRTMTPIQGSLSVAYDTVRLPLAAAPSREEFQQRLEDRNVHVQRHARRQLERLEQGRLPDSYDLPLQVWRFGDALTLVGIAGEVVVDYALRLKRELGRDRLWLAGYANDVPAYIPSLRILVEGGYEADFSMIYYDMPARWAYNVEGLVIGKIHELVQTSSEQ